MEQIHKVLQLASMKNIAHAQRYDNCMNGTDLPGTATSEL